MVLIHLCSSWPFITAPKINLTKDHSTMSNERHKIKAVSNIPLTSFKFIYKSSAAIEDTAICSSSDIRRPTHVIQVYGKFLA